MIFKPACKTREKYAKMLTLVAQVIGRILRFFPPHLYILCPYIFTTSFPFIINKHI